MPENWEDRRSTSRGRDSLPYNSQDWNRRLAEARARRAATLRQRGSLRGTVPASDSLAAAWDGDQDGLAGVTQPICTPVGEAPETEIPEHDTPEPSLAAPGPPSDEISGRWPGPAVTLLAGCLLGSAVTGLLFVAWSAGWRADPAPPGAGALMASMPAASAEAPAPAPPEASAPPAEAVAERPATARPAAAPDPPIRTARADRVLPGDHGPESTEPPAGTARPAASRPAPATWTGMDDTLPTIGGPAPLPTAVPLAPDASLPTGWSPAAGPTRQLATPASVNAPQVEHDALPAAPSSIQRVVVLAPNSVSGAGRDEAAALLREAGWPARDPRTSPFTISSTHVRFYHPGDREGAERLASLFSAEARDFTGYSPRPPTGSIELWLAGRAPPRESARRGPSLTRFLGRIAAALDGRG